VGRPAKTFADCICSAQVFGGIDSAEFLIVECAWKNKLISFSSYPQQLTLVWLEFMDQYLSHYSRALISFWRVWTSDEDLTVS
jgi:hypothetical protein